MNDPDLVGDMQSSFVVPAPINTNYFIENSSDKRQTEFPQFRPNNSSRIQIGNSV